MRSGSLTYSLFTLTPTLRLQKKTSESNFKRGGLTKEEAKRRAKKATETIAKSKKMQFDLRVTMMKGRYNEGAKKVLSQIPLTNPVVKPRTLPTPLQAVNIKRAERGEAPITASEYLRTEKQIASAAIDAKFAKDTRDINEWNRQQPRILESSPSMRTFIGTKDDFGEHSTDSHLRATMQLFLMGKTTVSRE